MRILIYGAGVIGSLYAALFAEAGYDTNIYARGKRLEVLRNNGLLYKKNQEVIKAEIRILRELPNDDIYDFVLLTVRENQLYEALTELKNNKSNTIVTMMNSLDSYNKWEDIVGKGRILPAFPGAGGSIVTDMHLWQLCHLAMVVPIADAYYESDDPEKVEKEWKSRKETDKKWTEGRNMVFKTTGNKSGPVVLFFHAMGVTGESSMPVADKMAGKFYCIMPTSTVYCSGQRYCSKRDEVQQMVRFLEKHEIKEIELVVASSIGVDLAMAFVTNAKIPVKHIFFDGGQFAQIRKTTRRIMVPFLYIAMKSLYWSKGKTLKRIMWCDDDKIKPYFIEAGKNLTYRNLRRQLTDSLEDKPFPKLPEELQKHTFLEFGSKEEHFKYRSAVMQTYIYGNFPVFDGFNHMQYQIRNPEGFARMLETIMETDRLPKLTFAGPQTLPAR